MNNTILKQKQNKSPLGQILLNGGFLSTRDLALALEEQRHTNELLGKVLVRMGVLDPVDLHVALSVQKYLNRPEDAVEIAAGVRQLLGDMLVQAGQINSDKLDQALAVQKKSGAMLGEILLRMDLLTARQLDSLLGFQKVQALGKSSGGPLKLGEIMVAAGYVSRQQLEEALSRQGDSHKKIGEVLVDSGYAKLHHVKRGIRLQQMLMTAVLAGMLTACGGGGGGGGEVAVVDTPSTATVAVSENVVNTTPQAQEPNINYLVATSDDYGLVAPTFYYSTDNERYWTIQSDLAADINDKDFLTIMRIQIDKAAGVMPAINKTFSIDWDPQYEQFPGVFVIPNGQQSTAAKVERGLISFTPDTVAAGEVKGSFDVMLTDYDSELRPAPEYRITGQFRFKMGTYGPAVATPE